MELWKQRRDERGSTLIEAAIVYGLLFLTLFAVIEFGLAFKDWLTVSHASREGARAGATYGNDPRADMQILRDLEGPLKAASIANGIQIRVFEAGTAPPINGYTYTPGTDGSDLSPGGILAGTTCDWTPCPDPWRASYTPPPWLPSTRDIEAPFTDRIAIQIQFTHNWLTGFFSPAADFTTTTDFQIEPQVFSS